MKQVKTKQEMFSVSFILIINLVAVIVQALRCMSNVKLNVFQINLE